MAKRSPFTPDPTRAADRARDLELPAISETPHGRPCDKCGNEIERVRDAFVRVIYPTRIVRFHVCRRCADTTVATMKAATARKAPPAA